MLLPLFPRYRQLRPGVHFQFVGVQPVVVPAGPFHLIERRVERQPGGHPDEHVGAQAVPRGPVVEFVVA